MKLESEIGGTSAQNGGRGKLHLILIPDLGGYKPLLMCVCQL